MVEPIKISKYASKGKEQDKNQVILSLTMDEWEELVEIFGLQNKKAQIQHDFKSIKALTFHLRTHSQVESNEHYESFETSDHLEDQEGTPKAENPNGEWVSLQELGTEGQGTTTSFNGSTRQVLQGHGG